MIKTHRIFLFVLLIFPTIINVNAVNASNGPTFNGNDLVLRLPHVFIQPDGIRFDNIEIRLGTDGFYHILSGIQAPLPVEPATPGSPTFDWGDGILRIPNVLILPNNYVYNNVEILLGGNGVYRVLAAEPDVQSNRGTMTNVFEPGDRYDYILEPAPSGSRFAEIWDIISDRNVLCWVAESNPLYSFQFFVAPPLVPNPPPNTLVPSYRYTGFDVFSGTFVTLSTGTYVRANSPQTYLAAGVATWDTAPEFLVVIDAGTIVHVIQHFDGTPIVNIYRPGIQCP